MIRADLSDAYPMEDGRGGVTVVLPYVQVGLAGQVCHLKHLGEGSGGGELGGEDDRVRSRTVQ